MNYRLARKELDDLLERISPLYLIADEQNTDRYQARADITLLAREEFLGTTLGVEAPEVSWPESPSAVAVQLFTSGTTGKPKAALLKNEHLLSYILDTVEFMSAEAEEATLVSVPPYHVAGVSGLLSSIYACRRIVQLPQFDAAEWVELAERERPSNAFVVPTMLSRIIDHLDSMEQMPRLESLRAVAYGGGKMPRQVIERALEIFQHVDFTNAYGLTETSSTITLLGPEDHRSALTSSDPGARERLASVGRALPTVEIEIRDQEGRVLGVNEPGEVYVRGAQISGEYQERSALDDQGWFATRDTGRLDEDGYLFLSGRVDDVIVRGGENISPSEIENVLLSHEAVADAAAVAIASEEWGEAVAAAVAEELGESALAIGCDVSSPESVRTAFEAIAKKHPRIDVLINNAAIYAPFKVVNASDDQILNALATNLGGPMLCTRSAIPLMEKGAHIINVTSESVALPFPHMSVYQSSKAGLEQFSACLSRELERDGIRVSIVRAGSMYEEGKTWDVDPQAAKEFHEEAAAAGIDLRTRPISHFTSVTGIFRTLIDLPADLHAASVGLHARAPN